VFFLKVVIQSEKQAEIRNMLFQISIVPRGFLYVTIAVSHPVVKIGLKTIMRL